MARKKLFFFEFPRDGRAPIPVVVVGYTKKEAVEKVIEMALDKNSGEYYKEINPHYYAYHGHLEISAIPSGQVIAVRPITEKEGRSPLMKGKPEGSYLPVIMERE